MGAAVVRDRNVAGVNRDYDRDKVQYLLRTCDAIVAFCYGRTRIGDGWQTSGYVRDEISLAASTRVRWVIVLRERGLVDPELDRIMRAVPSIHVVDVEPESPDRSLDLRRFVLDACGEQVRASERQIFTVIPFESDFSQVFRVIQSIVGQSTGLPIRRMKDMLVGTASRDVPVVDAILEAIRTSPLVVLELSRRNPNCFFEAGVAVATGVPTIRLIRDEEEIPFDLRHWGFIKYRDLTDLQEKLVKETNRFAREEVTIDRAS